MAWIRLSDKANIPNFPTKYHSTNYGFEFTNQTRTRSKNDSAAQLRGLSVQWLSLSLVILPILTLLLPHLQAPFRVCLPFMRPGFQLS